MLGVEGPKAGEVLEAMGVEALPGPGKWVWWQTRLVAAGIHSRRRAADELGVADPDAEFERWQEEARSLAANAAASADQK